MLCRATIDFETALSIIADCSAPLGVERVPLARAGRRRLAEPVIATLDAPQFDAAAMDGHAVRSSEVEGGRTRFALAGVSFAGDRAIDCVPEGSAVRVSTGAPMPVGLDQVIVTEAVVQHGEWIAISGPAPDKRHVRRRGSDFRAGDCLLPVGREIEPRAMVVAAAANLCDLTVWRRPRVACLTNGNELAAPGSDLAGDAACPDSLSEAILLLGRQWGAKPAGTDRTVDNADALAAAADRLLADCDVLVIVGGAARGDRDFAKSALSQLDLSISFSDVAIKPGKPVWYGQAGAKHVLGLPGNPTAAMTTARLFLAPLLTILGGGSAEEALRFTWLPLGTEFVAAGSREQFLCGARDGPGIRLLEKQAASMQSTLADAELLVRVPAGMGPMSKGSLVQTLRF